MNSGTGNMGGAVKLLAHNNEARQQVELRMPFTNKTGSFRGYLLSNIAEVGFADKKIYVYDTENGLDVPLEYETLSEEHAKEFCMALIKSSQTELASAYVVYSYKTPIAWTDGSGGSKFDKLIIPNVFYSPTTEKHQAFISLSDNVKVIN